MQKERLFDDFAFLHVSFLCLATLYTRPVRNLWPIQDSTWLSVVFFMWLVCVRASWMQALRRRWSMEVDTQEKEDLCQ